MKPQRFPERGVWRAVATVCVLALAPAIGVGIARFAYSLLLPDMRASLGWTYAAAGFMNTVNAAGYLIGASIAAAIMRRIGQHGAIVRGSLACVLALALSTVTDNFTVLSLARLAAGIGGAVAFVAGGVAAVRIAQRHAGHAAFLVSLYYIGPGLGILLSGIITPALLVELGPGSWWVGWGVFAVLTAIMRAVLALARLETPASKIEETRVRVAAETDAHYCCELLFVQCRDHRLHDIHDRLARQGWRGGDCAGGLLVLAGAWRNLLAVPLVMGDCSAVGRSRHCDAHSADLRRRCNRVMGRFADRAAPVCVHVRIRVAGGGRGNHSIRTPELSVRRMAQRSRCYDRRVWARAR